MLIVFSGAAINNSWVRGQDEPEFRLVDEFDGEFNLVWEPIENDDSLKVDYSLDLTKSPREIVLSSLTREFAKPVHGICALEGEALTICLALAADAPAPTELKTTEGDTRLLIQLERAGKESTVNDGG
jgi:uncharacterized protein (TIGR03067 family)